MNLRWIFVLGAALVASGGSIAACTGEGGNVDAGNDAAIDATTDAALDAGAPHCFVDGGGSNDPAASPGFGFFIGAGASGDLCLGGAFAVVQQVPGSQDASAQTLFVIETGDFGDPNTFFQFQSPAGTVSGSLAIDLGLTSAAPGSYSSDGACGNLVFCAIMPTPAVDCGDAAAPTTCPMGCGFVETGGPCVPITPEDCFIANGVSDCAGNTMAPVGSWELTLASATPFADDASAEIELVAHGVFRGTLMSDAASTTITIGF